LGVDEDTRNDKQDNRTKWLWLRRVGGVALGAAAGFAYYQFVGCSSGGCPMWQDPVVSSGMGALLGTTLTW
jgi:hypothetical protein